MMIISDSLKLSIPIYTVNNYLLFNNGINSNNGINGRLGVSIYFFIYGRFKKKSIFCDYALTLLTQIIADKLYKAQSYTFDFQNGLAGLGWSFIRLVSKGFFNSNIEDFCKSIDTQIIRFLDDDKSEIEENTLPYIYTGICFYFTERLSVLSDKSYADKIEKYLLLAVENLNNFRNKREWLDLKHHFLLEQAAAKWKSKSIKAKSDFFLENDESFYKKKLIDGQEEIIEKYNADPIIKNLTVSAASANLMHYTKDYNDYLIYLL